MYLANIVYFNKISVESRPWNKLGVRGEGVVTLAAFIFLMSETCFAGSLLIMIGQNSGPN